MDIVQTEKNWLRYMIDYIKNIPRGSPFNNHMLKHASIILLESYIKHSLIEAYNNIDVTYMGNDTFKFDGFIETDRQYFIHFTIDRNNLQAIEETTPIKVKNTDLYCGENCGVPPQVRYYGVNKSFNFCPKCRKEIV